MPGFAFLNKKEFHTGSFKNIELVWLAEQHKEQQDQRIREHRKRLNEERYEEELKRAKVQQGLIAQSEMYKMDWMYNQANLDKERNIADEYLLGKPIEEQPKRATFRENGLNEGNEEFKRTTEDPLLLIKRQQMRRGHVGGGNNLSYYIGVKNERKVASEEFVSQTGRSKKIEKLKGSDKQSEHSHTTKLLEKYIKDKMGPLTTLDRDANKLRFNALKPKQRPTIPSSEQGYKDMERNAKDISAASHGYRKADSERNTNTGSNPQFIRDQIRTKFEIKQ